MVDECYRIFPIKKNRKLNEINQCRFCVGGEKTPQHFHLRSKFEKEECSAVDGFALELTMIRLWR
jgi:hypothetical protein